MIARRLLFCACGLAVGLQTTLGYGAIYTVISTNDSGAGSLRQAIVSANTNTGFDEIRFSITGSPPFVISLMNALNAITNPVSIDGGTQSGYSGSPLITLDGSKAGGFPTGLAISTSGSVVRALTVRRFYDGIVVNGSDDGGSNRVEACIVISNRNDGIEVGGYNNRIGGPGAAYRNVVSTNSIGIVAWGPGTVIQGNYVGTGTNGASPWGNGRYGIRLAGYDVLVGGTNAGEGNVISCNGESGINISEQIGAVNNRIQGNYIGTDAGGTMRPGPQPYGIYLYYCGPSNCISGNVISGNGIGPSMFRPGIYLQADRTLVTGNLIGTDKSGMLSVSNYMGISLQGNWNIIGGTNASERNVISGNVADGIELQANATSNRIIGNFIGAAITGTNALPNNNGISVQSGATNWIGGAQAGAGNVISGNRNFGIQAFYAADLTIQGNYIGMGSDGRASLGNGASGIYLYDCRDVLIGGTNAGARNVIAANGNSGIEFNGSADCQIQGNYIGVDVTGIQAAAPQGGSGVVLNDSPSNLVGGVGVGNVIGGNAYHGVSILYAGSTSNTVAGNWIGTDRSGAVDLGNGFYGAFVWRCTNTVIGGTTPGAGNAIMFNYVGVVVTNAQRCAILGNSIYRNDITGIDLDINGTTFNDAGDGDNGANGLQNFPVLTQVFVGSTHITGTFNSKTNQKYRLEFFASPEDEPGGYGEGRDFIGTTNVTTDASGNVAFSVVFPQSYPTGWVVAATATDTNGNTSEFSAHLPIVKAPDTDGNGVADFWETAYFGHLLGTAATNDPDHDGMTTLQEYLADTHPSNSASCLRIRSIAHDSGYVVGFTSSVGRVYALECAPNLVVSVWSNLVNSVPGNGATLTLVDTNSPPGRLFYRVTAKLP